MSDQYLIKGLQIGGFRSYNKEGHSETDVDFRRINLFIGPNNSGKSNIINLFKKLQEHILEPNLKVLKEDVFLQGDKDKETIFGYIELNIGTIIFANDEDKIRIVNSKGSDINLESFFKDYLCFIDTDRKNTCLDDLFSRIDDYEDYKYRMAGWLEKVLDEKVDIDWDDIDDRKKDNLKLTLYPTGQELNLNLSHLGTGIIQIIKILTFVYVNTTELGEDLGKNYFIEEPESNLHNKAVVQLIKILQEDSLFKNNRYFITTHSNAFIDQTDDKEWTISSLEINGSRSTELKLCISKDGILNTLDGLGIKPSQLLQTNIVLWVEGPTDRMYIKRWLEIEAPQYIEGKHYSFIMYGGSLLDHLSAEVDPSNIYDQYIDVLATSRYAVIVIDRDRNDDDHETNLKKRVEGIKCRISKKKLSNRILIQITKGREIENFIPKELMIKALSKINKRSVEYQDNGVTEKICFKKHKSPIESDYEFNLNDSFDEKYAHWLLTDEIMEYYNLDKGTPTYERIIKKLQVVSKVTLANNVLSLLKNRSHITDPLRGWLKEVIEKIEQANRV
ncbi:AAA family ATPase [Bacillus cereus]|uniref:ATP-dependent nuclease n=1 Tax=Bacillus cereus TaxID=1396 RepID=UPI00285338D3|nr:AAA family ATPase [Bacillus cereus]MDR4985937.1 AAA family ATPase [Bacillus cereus]